MIPLLFGGVFVVGFLGSLLPEKQVAALVGDNSLPSNLIASVVGCLFYFATQRSQPGATDMKKVQVLGPGCPKCSKLAENAQAAVDALGADATVEKVTDIMEITNFGVMMTPALAIDGEVKVVGKVPSTEEIKQMLS